MNLNDSSCLEVRGLLCQIENIQTRIRDLSTTWKSHIEPSARAFAQIQDQIKSLKVRRSSNERTHTDIIHIVPVYQICHDEVM